VTFFCIQTRRRW